MPFVGSMSGNRYWLGALFCHEKKGLCKSQVCVIKKAMAPEADAKAYRQRFNQRGKNVLVDHSAWDVRRSMSWACVPRSISMSPLLLASLPCLLAKDSSLPHTQAFCGAAYCRHRLESRPAKAQAHILGRHAGILWVGVNYYVQH